jgi:hypothetical protein
VIDETKLVKAMMEQMDRIDKRVTRIYAGQTIAAVVTEVDLVNKIALVVTDDENAPIEVQAHSGWLPAVGDEILLGMNGTEPINNETRHFVDGAMASQDYIPGEAGWIITADGDCEFANGEFRGTVTAKLVRTAVDGARIEIDAQLFKQGIRFYSGDDQEEDPGQVYTTSNDDEAVIRMDAPVFTDMPPSSIVPEWKFGIRRTTPAGSFFNVNADDIEFNGTSFNRPPLSMKRRVAPLGPIASSTTGFQAVIWDTNTLVNGPDAITLDGTTGTWTIHRKGAYMLYVTVASWEDGLVNGHRTIQAVVGGSGRTIDKSAAIVTGNTCTNASTPILVGTTAITVQVRLNQYNTSGPVSLSPIEIRGTLTRISD